MVKYLLDTNFLMYCVKEKIDFLEELGKGNIIIPMGVILELEGIKREGSVRDKDVADIVLKMIADIKKINLGDGHVDNLIINFAKNNDVIVGTMDKTLQKRIKKNGIRILEIVGRKKLRIE